MKLLIRPARLDEFEAVYRVYREAFDRLKGEIDPPSSAEGQSPASLRKALDHSDVLVAELDRQLAGCVFYREEEAGIYLYRLAVATERENQGIGTHLVTAVEQWAQLSGYPHISLNVRINLAKNQALFTRLGYAEVSRHAHKGYQHDTYIRMRKNLS